MSVSVVDTNVVLVANGQHSEVSIECRAECAEQLQAIMRNGKLALDSEFLILAEYQNKTKPKTGSRPGDAFVKWALRNSRNPKHVDAVAITQHSVRGFDSFPDDERLATFDPADRKFVAVACAHPKKPAILQAVDSKWIVWAAPLQSHGIAVEFVCRSDIERFHEKKFGR